MFVLERSFNLSAFFLFVDCFDVRSVGVESLMVRCVCMERVVFVEGGREGGGEERGREGGEGEGGREEREGGREGGRKKGGREGSCVFLKTRCSGFTG